jgi:hypothetical protein
MLQISNDDATNYKNQEQAMWYNKNCNINCKTRNSPPVSTGSNSQKLEKSAHKEYDMKKCHVMNTEPNLTNSESAIIR